MPEELNTPQNESTDPMPGMPSFSDLEKLADEVRETGEGDGGVVEDKGSEVSSEVAPPAEQDKAEFQGKLQKHGFKSENDLLKSYEEAHAKITKLSMSEAETRKQLASLAADYDRAVMALRGQSQQKNQGQAEVNDEDEALFKTIAPMIAKVVDHTLTTREARKEYEENLNFILEKRGTDPEKQAEFDKMVPYFAKVIKENPRLDNRRDFDKVFEAAQKMRNRELILDALADGASVDKVYEMLGKKEPTSESNETVADQGKAKAAFVPPSGAASMSVSKQTNFNDRIKKAKEDGDLDSVIDLVFKRAEANWSKK